MVAYIRSGGAVWSVPAFVASRLAALASPVHEQAAAELVGVALALRDAAGLADREVAA